MNDWGGRPIVMACSAPADKRPSRDGLCRLAHQGAAQGCRPQNAALATIPPASRTCDPKYAISRRTMSAMSSTVVHGSGDARFVGEELILIPQ